MERTRNKMSVEPKLEFVSERHRDRRGRFCTEERQAFDKALSENKYLRLEREKWYRAYKALSEDNSRLTREISALKQEITNMYERQKHCIA